MNLSIVKPVMPSNASTDKNGNKSILLTCIAGKMPNKAYIAGTVAQRNGFELGKNYLISWTELEPNEYGRQFSFEMLQSIVSALELVQLCKEVGEKAVFDATATKKTTDTTAKSQVITVDELDSDLEEMQSDINTKKNLNEKVPF